MKVKELIEILQTKDPEMLVLYECFSERTLMYPTDIYEVYSCKPRPDGWVQNERPDKPTQKYLCFPGN